MVQHIVLWRMADHLKTAEEIVAAKAAIKARLEGLIGVIDGIVSLRVETDLLPGSNADIALYSLFTSAEALAAYQVHPAHVEASGFVGERVQGRACGDFLVDERGAVS